jgi:hypothetical protein
MDRITDLDRITTAIDPTGAIESYLWDEILGCQWESIGQIISQLEMASCSAGSWSDMIYTQDILDKLSDPQWVEDIESAFADYEGNTGEAFDFDAVGGFSLSSTVTFAVDWVAQQLASKLRYLDKVAIVTVASDSMDPSPDRIAFSTVWEAEDWVAEEVARRVQYQVDHSPHPVSEEDLMDMQEEEMLLFNLDEERL